MFSQYTPDRVNAAIKAHGTKFFDKDLNPVVPQPGDWFCEFDLTYRMGKDGMIFDRAVDGAFVEYICKEKFPIFDLEGNIVYHDIHVVVPEGCEFDRQPQGNFLIKQG